MRADLETRRRRIAAALRAVMAEPLPHRQPSATRAPEPDPTPVSAPEPSRDLPSLRDSLTASIDWDEVDEVPLEDESESSSPPVPPVELAGAMSSTAARALFGHE